MVIGILMTALIILPVISIEPFSTTITERIATFDDTDTDGSLNSRREALFLLIGHAATEFVGGGLENPITPGVVVSKEYVIGDNGMLVIFFALGWIGGLPYLLSLTLLIFQIRQACLKNQDLVLQATYAIILGHVSQILFKSLTIGGFAMVLWGFIGMGMSARNYYLSQINSQNVQNV